MKAALDIEALYRTYGHLVLRRASQILGPGQEAEDALQEIFASLVDRPEQFSGRSAPSTFLYSVTTNHCLTRMRNQRTRLRLLERAKPDASEEAMAASGERAILLRQFLRTLPDELQEAAVYAYVDELTQQEIADVMDCSRRHIVNLLGRVRVHAEQFERSHSKREVAS